MSVGSRWRATAAAQTASDQVGSATSCTARQRQASLQNARREACHLILGPFVGAGGLGRVRRIRLVPPCRNHAFNQRQLAAHIGHHPDRGG